MTLRDAFRQTFIVFLRKTFGFWERLGFHITPVHYFQPIPDTRRLHAATFERRTEAVGVDFRIEEQLQLLAAVRDRCEAEYRGLPKARTANPAQFFHGNGAFEAVDAEMLYGMVRLLKPRKLIEIGSGSSTLLAAQAARANAAEGSPCEIVAIEPYPTRTLSAGVPGVTLRPVEVQSVPLAEFEALGENDILFIDSTHVLRIGGDVQYELLEILPRLRPGVSVHFHDIFLPAEYPQAWVRKFRWFWNEQYAVQAFLAFNDSFRVTFSAAYLHLQRPELLESAFPSYDRTRTSPGSLWLRRVR